MIALLAETDALFVPTRQWQNNKNALAILERQTEFARAGIPFLGGGDIVDRKVHQRAADELEATGLVRFSRARVKRTMWKLTNAADWKMRELCNEPGFPEMLAAMLLLGEHARAGHVSGDCGNVGYVPETALLAMGWGSAKANRQILELEQLFAPAFCRGLVWSASDCAGRVAYRLQPKGWKFIENPVQPPELPEWSEEASQSYLDQFLQALAQRARAKPRAENCAAIPLSAGLWPRPEGRADVPSVFCRKGRPRTLRAVQAAIG